MTRSSRKVRVCNSGMLNENLKKLDWQRGSPHQVFKHHLRKYGTSRRPQTRSKRPTLDNLTFAGFGRLNPFTNALYALSIRQVLRLSQRRSPVTLPYSNYGRFFPRHRHSSQPRSFSNGTVPLFRSFIQITSTAIKPGLFSSNGRTQYHFHILDATNFIFLEVKHRNGTPIDHLNAVSQVIAEGGGEYALILLIRSL